MKLQVSALACVLVSVMSALDMEARAHTSMQLGMDDSCSLGTSADCSVALLQTGAQMLGRHPHPHASLSSVVRSVEGHGHGHSFVSEFGNGFEQMVRLIKHPPPKSSAYNLAHPRSSYSQDGQDLQLMDMFKHIQDGFFVEAGAFNGEKHSNTLLVESKLHWNGLLVEPVPRDYEELAKKNRKAFLFQGALSPSGKIESMQFEDTGPEYGSLVLEGKHPNQRKPGFTGSNAFNVTAAPLEALMKIVKRETVDFLSLDVGGNEAAILKAIDFAKIEVGVLLVQANKAKKPEIAKIMQSSFFRKVGETKFDDVWVNPRYFVLRSLKAPTKL